MNSKLVTDFGKPVFLKQTPTNSNLIPPVCFLPQVDWRYSKWAPRAQLSVPWDSLVGCTAGQPRYPAAPALSNERDNPVRIPAARSISGPLITSASGRDTAAPVFFSRHSLFRVALLQPKGVLISLAPPRPAQSLQCWHLRSLCFPIAPHTHKDSPAWGLASVTKQSLILRTSDFHKCMLPSHGASGIWKRHCKNMRHTMDPVFIQQHHFFFFVSS